MIILPNFVQITVCANSPAELEHWRKFWENILGEHTASDAIGFGNGVKECSIVITHWFAGLLEDLICELLPAFQIYQREAQQEAVFLVLCAEGRLTAYSIGSDDWQAFLDEINRGLALANWFTRGD